MLQIFNEYFFLDYFVKPFVSYYCEKDFVNSVLTLIGLFFYFESLN